MESYQRMSLRACAILIMLGSIPMFAAATSYDTHSGTITTQTWTTGTTHYISADLIIADNHTLTIESGVTVKFAAGAELFVQGTLDVNGAAGTNNDVLFTSKDDDSRGDVISGSDGVPSAGDWDGIYLWGNDCCTFYDAVAAIDYSTIRYAGKSGARDAAILWSSDANGSITNSTVEYSQTNGIWLSYCDLTAITIDNTTISNNGGVGVLTEGWTRIILTNNVLTNNTGKAAYVARASEATMSGNTGSGNGINGIEIYWSDLTNASTWGTSSTLPIILNDVTSVSDGVTLTINAGSIIKGKTNSRLSISGTLDANGTSGSNIVFTSYKDDTYGGNTDGVEATPAGGDWKGINMYGDGANDGIGYLDYCRVRYGMAPAWGGTYGNVEFNQSEAGNFTNSISEYAGGAGVTVESCSPTITGSTISNNGTYGIYVQGGTASAPVITDNTLNNNGDYAVYLNSIVPTSYSGNSGTGNVKNRFGWYGTVSSSVTLSGTLPFELIYPVSVSSGQTLTIASGSIYFENQYVSGAGNFTLGSGALMETKATDGIYSGTSYGCVLVEGTRSFSPGAKYLFDRGATQYTGDVFPAAVAELTVANSTPLTMTNDITVSGTLTLTSGRLMTGVNTLTVGTSALELGSVTSAGGAVVGNLKRWFADVTVNDVLFPVGTAGKYLPAKISFTGAPSVGGTVTVKFFASDPGSAGLPLSDGAVSLVNHAAEGYWSLVSGNGLTGGTYSLQLTTDAFSGITDHTKLHVLKRANSGSNWVVEGTHSAGTGSNAAAVVHRTGLTSFSEFGVAAPTDNALPVELTSFAAAALGRTIELRWSTATETNNYGFEVQRSIVTGQHAASDAGAWTTVGFVSGSGTSSAAQDYRFADRVSVPGVFLYRLKQIDRDGSYRYSEPVEVTVTELPAAFGLEQNYPNPFNPETTIRYRLMTAGFTTLKVFDALGREVATLVSEMQEAGPHEILFQASHLPSGVYVAVLSSGDRIHVRKMQLMK